MIYILINLVPILLATLAGLVAGALVHRAAGGVTRGLPSAALASAWFASILAGALILAPADKAPPGAPPWLMPVMTAVVIWIGFVAPALVVTLRHRGLAWAAVGVESFYWLVVMLAQAVVLHAWGLVPPPA